MTTNVTNTVITMMVLATIGLIMKKTGKADKRTDKFVSELMVTICTPALMLHTTLTNFTIPMFISSYKGILIALSSMLLMVIISTMLSNIFSIKGSEKGEFIAMSSFSNTVFIGLPLITGIFGEKAVPYLMLFYIANTISFWSIGIYMLSKSTGKGFNIKDLLRIFNPPIIGFIIGLILLWYNISIPSYALKSLEYLKILVTPLSLLYMGSTLGDLNFGNMGSPVRTASILILRFVVSPAICFLLLKLVPMPKELVQVFIVCAGLPVMTNISIAVGKYGGKPSYSAFMTALTSVMIIFVIPIYIKLFSYI